MSLTTRAIYALPTLPTLGGANFKFPDPTFGSRMVRVADGAFITDLGTTNRSFTSPSAGYQQAWNADGTKFIIVAGSGEHFLLSFNRITMDCARLGAAALPFLKEPAHWDPTNPNVLYGVGTAGNHHTIVKVDVTSIPWTTTTLLDLDTITAGLSDTYVGALTVANGRLMATYGGSSQEYMRYVISWPLPSGTGYKVINTVTREGMDSANTKFSSHGAQQDKSGRIVDIVPTGSVVEGRAVAPHRNYFWDVDLDLVTPCLANSGGHEVLGWMQRINNDALGTWDGLQWVLTPDLTTVNSGRADVISPVMTPTEIYIGEHSSWHNFTAAGAPPPFVTATYRYYDGPLNVDPKNNNAWRCWDGEVLKVHTDGSGIVERFCHHRTQVHPDTGVGAFDFFYTPRSNVDRQGQFALFTSNWEKTLGLDSAVGNYRQDPFIVELLSDTQRDARVRGRRREPGAYAR